MVGPTANHGAQIGSATTGPDSYYYGQSTAPTPYRRTGDWAPHTPSKEIPAIISMGGPVRRREFWSAFRAAALAAKPYSGFTPWAYGGATFFRIS